MNAANLSFKGLGIYFECVLFPAIMFPNTKAVYFGWSHVLLVSVRTKLVEERLDGT